MEPEAATWHWAEENRTEDCARSATRTHRFTELHANAPWSNFIWTPLCTTKSVLSTIAKCYWIVDWTSKTRSWGAISWNASKQARFNCHPDSSAHSSPMFQTNDPRFWKAAIGIISLVLSCALALLILKLWAIPISQSYIIKLNHSINFKHYPKLLS